MKWDYLRATRKSKGLTQDELAKKVGVSKGTIYDWERGAYMPTDASNISALEEALGLGNGELYKQLYANPTRPPV